MNCTSQQQREWIAKNYKIVSGLCLKLLHGETRISDANHRVITDKYYSFQIINKLNDDDKQIIILGEPTAREMCRLMKFDLPKLFNPFVVKNEGGAGESGENPSNIEKVKWNPCRKELYNAFMLFITAYQNHLTAGTPIFQIKEEIEKFPNIYPPPRLVNSVNSIFKKWRTNIPRVINILEDRNQVKEFSFDNILEDMKQRGVQQYIMSEEDI